MAASLPGAKPTDLVTTRAVNDVAPPADHNRPTEELLALIDIVGLGAPGASADIAARLGALPQTVRKTADQTIAATTYANVTDLVFPVVVGEDCLVEFLIMWRTNTAGTVGRYTLTWPAVTDAVVLTEAAGQTTLPTAGGTDMMWDQTINTSGADPSGFVGGTSIPAANVSTITRITALFQNFTAAGSVQVQHRIEATTATITTRRGSFGRKTSN